MNAFKIHSVFNKHSKQTIPRAIYLQPLLVFRLNQIIIRGRFLNPCFIRANILFLHWLNGDSLFLYPFSFFFCFVLSLSNYLAGVTSVKLKKASEAKKSSAGWIADRQMKKMQIGKSYFKFSLLNIRANWLQKRRCWCGFFLQHAAKPPTLQTLTKALRGSFRRALLNTSDAARGDTLPRLLNNALFCLASLWAVLDATLFCLLHHLPPPFFVPMHVKANISKLLDLVLPFCVNRSDL